MEPPSESDCCNSGCNPCILDIYELQLKKSESQPSNLINAIQLTKYTRFQLITKKQLSESAFLLNFEYSECREEAPNCFSYEPSQYLLLRAKDSEGEFTRAYTPIPHESTPKLGFTVLVRCYEEGRMSRILRRLKLGADTSWRGPYGELSLNFGRHLLCVAQGTGIAPLFALIDSLIRNEECETLIRLFFCCRSPSDIFLRDELYEFTSYWNFTYEVFLSNAANLTRKYNEVVHESKLGVSQLRDFLADKLGDTTVVLCGSETFSQQLKSEIDKLGIESSRIYLL